MSKNKFHDMIRIADIHASRIEMALTKLRPLFPFNAENVATLSADQDLPMIELLIRRFAMLQDYLGSQVINEFLRITKDYNDNLTMLDKLHKLERLEVIEDSELWTQMRKARNRISHEYPDEPALTAKYLNQLFTLAPKLLDILNTIKARAK